MVRSSGITTYRTPALRAEIVINGRLGAKPSTTLRSSGVRLVMDRQTLAHNIGTHPSLRIPTRNLASSAFKRLGSKGLRGLGNVGLTGIRWVMTNIKQYSPQTIPATQAISAVVNVLNSILRGLDYIGAILFPNLLPIPAMAGAASLGDNTVFMDGIDVGTWGEPFEGLASANSGNMRDSLSEDSQEPTADLPRSDDDAFAAFFGADDGETIVPIDFDEGGDLSPAPETMAAFFTDTQDPFAQSLQGFVDRTSDMRDGDSPPALERDEVPLIPDD